MKNELKTNNSWLQFLDPENLKGNLIYSSLYIALFEALKDYVVSEVASFFSNGFTDTKTQYSERYTTHVKDKDKNLVKASMLWLKECEAINDVDLEVFEELRLFRNKLSHELLTLLFSNLTNELPEKLDALVSLRIKIETWWILNVELPTDPNNVEFSHIKENDIIASSEILLKLLSDILSGDEKKASFYVNEFKKSIN